MHWETLTWVHITCDCRGLAVWKLGCARLAMGLFVVSTLCVAVHDETTAIATFTVWCWSLIGVYMLVTAALSLAHMMGVRADRGYGGQLLSAAVWVLFELLFTTAILVFVVVWFVLVPKVGPNMLRPIPLCMHNLNVVFMSVEMMLNRLVILRWHAPFAIYFGICYVVFSWLYFFLCGRFFYFFLDWRWPFAPIAYLVLLGILLCSFIASQRLVSYAKGPSSVAMQLPGPPRGDDNADLVLGLEEVGVA